jgi:hypothetical protein
MSGQRAIGTFLLFSIVVIALTTCEMQLNKSGNALTLRFVLIHGNTGGGAQSASTVTSKAKVILPISQSLTVTISEGTAIEAQTTVAIASGQPSVDVSFNSVAPGSYTVSAQAYDGPNGSGNLLSHVSTQLNVTPGMNPVTLTMLSTLLANMVLTNSASPPQSDPSLGFSPTIYSYSFSSWYPGTVPVLLTLTTADPTATLFVTEVDIDSDDISTGNYTDLLPGSPSGSTCSLGIAVLNKNNTVTIVVTAQDGTTQTYVITGPTGLG